ncbi:MAG: hypothetical protein Q8N12_01875 [Thermodesulfovibrionales bacterium]|nr:hypothetical protein [Thermodesulfovibrionales bacterium]
MIKTENKIKEFNFSLNTQYGLFVCAGGFEERSITFVSKVKKTQFETQASLLVQYLSQQNDNAPNFKILKDKLTNLIGKEPEMVSVHSDRPIQSFEEIKNKIGKIVGDLKKNTALIDISGMTHLWAIATIHACLSCGMHTYVTFTEAMWYYPLKSDYHKLIRAWRHQDYDISSEYLQSKALKSIHIAPEFGGNFRPGRQTCLMIFAGYEPNRIQGLVDQYAPGRLIVFYGKSPHKELHWRTNLSKELHKNLFSNWYLRETEISTLQVDEILVKLEEEFQIIKEQFDVAIAPQCSKMQALASYLFWRRHPEVQLIFTTPVSFNPKRYSRGARRTFIYEIT